MTVGIRAERVILGDTRRGAWNSLLPASILTKNIAYSEVLNEASQIDLKIDFVFVIRTTLFQFSLKITPDSRFVLFDSSVVCFPFC
jgi:hypothetical protein